MTFFQLKFWNEDVKYCEVYDKDSHELLGAFFAGWFLHNDKRSGGWKKQLVFNGSLAKVVDGKPALLTRKLTQTIFHEFGHLCHFLLSKSPIKFYNERFCCVSFEISRETDVGQRIT